MHDAGPETGQFQHLVIANPVNLPRLGYDARVGRVDALDVGVDLARIGAQHGGERDGGGVGATAAERRDVVVLIHPLKTGDDDNLPIAQGLGHASVAMLRMRTLV